MNIDIAPILRYWEFIADEMQVSREFDSFQNEYLKLTYGAGKINMMLKGRPDGAQPFGKKSYWEFVKSKRVQYASSGKRYFLSEDDIYNLLQEIMLYHARSVAYLKINAYQASARDATANMRMVDELIEFSENPEDVEFIKWLRPYLLMTYNKSLVLMAENNGNHEEALEYLDKGIEKIKKKFKLVDSSFEVKNLNNIRIKITKSHKDQKVSLRRELEHAIKEENYELAASLRDRLHIIKQKS